MTDRAKRVKEGLHVEKEQVYQQMVDYLQQWTEKSAAEDESRHQNMEQNVHGMTKNFKKMINQAGLINKTQEKAEAEQQEPPSRGNNKMKGLE